MAGTDRSGRQRETAFMVLGGAGTPPRTPHHTTHTHADKILSSGYFKPRVWIAQCMDHGKGGRASGKRESQGCNEPGNSSEVGLDDDGADDDDDDLVL